jgi:vanadium chloroperoxidase
MKDSILFWNEIALEANRVSHTEAGKREQNGPTLSSRALAIVHLAMYDAYAGVVKDPNLPPYLPELPKPEAGASAKAAVAAAAHATLSRLFPSQRAFFDSIFAGVGDKSNPGHNFGCIVAQAILKDRENDPTASACDYKPSPARGKHRVDPDNPDQGFDAPFYGRGQKVLQLQKRHELEKPPFDDNEYLQALRQVRGKGIAPELTGTLPIISKLERRRNSDRDFWAYDGVPGLGTPPRLYNQIVRRLAIAKGNTEAQNARLFALVNVAMGDAGILAWDQKYIHELWRPVVGVREHDKSIGPAATEANNNISDDGDPHWLPLGAPATNSMRKNFTPNFPAYPSGHATFGAAALHITRLFYGVPSGDRNPDTLFTNLDFVSDEFNGRNQDNRGTVRPRHRRKFNNGLWRMIIENGRSRVYLGVHWVFDAFAVKDNNQVDLSRNVGGVPLGLTIAEDIFSNGLKKSTVGPRK